MDLYSRKNYFSSIDDPLRPKGLYQREYVSNMEVWCECFGNDRGKFEKQTDSYKIKLIMQKIGGWCYSSQKKKIKGYGAQYVWVRINEGQSKVEAITDVFPFYALRHQGAKS